MFTLMELSNHLANLASGVGFLESDKVAEKEQPLELDARDNQEIGKLLDKVFAPLPQPSKEDLSKFVKVNAIRDEDLDKKLPAAVEIFDFETINTPANNRLSVNAGPLLMAPAHCLWMQAP
ncbi:MAG TPA: hypothetical protein V6D17_12695 [Candidatus Obscuribacterales bacterium]